MEHNILKLKTEFLSGVKKMQLSTKRKWLEAGALANQHSLLYLPYNAMLQHVKILVEERQNMFPLQSPFTTDLESHSATDSKEDEDDEEYLKLPKPSIHY